jgi:hypothetical protein
LAKGRIPRTGVKTEVVRYPPARANEALADLRSGRLQGRRCSCLAIGLGIPAMSICGGV